MIPSGKFKKILDTIKANKKFVLTTHINPDGDAIGSVAAMYHFLRDLGKEVISINEHPTPEAFRFLDPEDTIINVYDSSYDSVIQSADVIIILDISTTERIGRAGPIILGSNALKICIDHHTSNNGLADINIIDQNACATAELIYDLIQTKEKTLTLPVARAVYVAILTDTGSFRFTNTSSRAHMIAGELIKHGLKPRDLYEKVYEMSSWQRMKLFGIGINSIQSFADGKIAAMTVSHCDLAKLGARKEDMEGLVDFPNSIKGVEMALLFFIRDENSVKISLRSKNEVDVNRFAKQFGGGGHKHAAGILVKDAKYNDMFPRIIQAATEELKQYSPK